MTGWRPAIRIARRSVTKHLARSILIAALVGVPVAGATLVDVLARTLSSPAREAERSMGAADATIGGEGPALDTLLPAGARVVAPSAAQPVIIGRQDGQVVMSEPDGPMLPGGVGGRVEIRGVQTATLVGADPNEPMHRNAVRLVSGRAPANDREALITKALADRLNIQTGSTIQGPDHKITITGIAKSPFCLTCEQLVQLPNATKQPPGQIQLVKLPDGANQQATWKKLRNAGYDVFTRDGSGNPPETSSTDLRGAALVALIAGFGLLEVILLAGTAFAVGARRQARVLGLVAASGGAPKHVRRIVLAEGVVLGALGGLAGVLLGITAAVALHPLWVNLDDAEITSYVFNPLELALAGLVGLFSGLAAAAVPAFGAARMQPVDALAGRFRVSVAARRGIPLAGLVLLAAGIAAGLAGNGMLAGDFKSYEKALATAKETGTYASPPSQTGAVAMTLLGATLLVAASVLLAPVVIGWIARVGKNLPVAGRLAVRDAARHRHRTGPTTSAIAVAVAGSVVVACVLAANWRAEQLQHIPALPPQTMVFSGEGSPLAAAEAAAAELPQASVLALKQPIGPPEDPGSGDPRPQGPPQLGGPGGEKARAGEARGLFASRECSLDCSPAAGSPLALADAASMKLTALPAAAREQLERGRIVIFGARGTGGAQTLSVHSGADTLQLPGYVVERTRAYGELPVGLVPESVAREHGWEIVSGGVFVSYGAKATEAQVQNAIDAATNAGAIASVEHEPEVPKNTTLLIMVAAAAFITLAGAAISIALSAAEGRADLATLAAVGAAPRRRRALAASQALLIAGTGCALGVGLGMFVAYTVRATTGAPGFVVPWLNVAATAIVVPLLAMAVAALFTPSRLPLVRRAA